MMESQLQILKTINNALKKSITNLEKQCSRNKQYSRCKKVCKLIGRVTGVNVKKDC